MPSSIRPFSESFHDIYKDKQLHIALPYKYRIKNQKVIFEIFDLLCALTYKHTLLKLVEVSLILHIK